MIVFLVIGMNINAQWSVQDKTYPYASVGFSSATIPNQTPKEYILNTVITVGVRDRLFDVSLNYEYANLVPKYHSYFVSAQVIPITTKKFEFGAGLKYGRIIREDTQAENQGGTYNYHGVFGEVRYTVWKGVFFSLVGSANYRGDIAYIWEQTYFDSYKWSTHLKIGYKF